MKYFQKFAYNEDGFGEQVCHFAVSDTYTELFDSAIGTETTVFFLKNTLEEIDVEEGRISSDKLDFDTNAISCNNENDLKALNFCLNAENVNSPRYCALFFDENPSNSELKFVGKIDTSIKAKDLSWQGDVYSSSPLPLRDYSFTATAFDANILSQVKLNSSIRAADFSIIPNMRDRLSGNVGFQALFENRPSFAIDSSPSAEHYGNIAYTAYLGNLHAVIQYMLDIASEIIYDLHGITLEFELLETPLGFATSPCKYGFKSHNRSLQITKVENNPDVRLKLYLSSSGEHPAGSSPAYISRKLVDAEYGTIKNLDNTIKYEFQEVRTRAEMPFSFMEIDNMQELLALIAQAFGLYFRSDYSVNKIALKLVPREEILQNAQTFLYGASEADTDFSIISSQIGNKYYADATAYTANGIDKIENEADTLIAKTSDLRKQKADMRAKEKDLRKIEYEKLLFSTSPTAIRFRGKGTLDTLYPLNLLGLKLGGETDWELKNFGEYGYMYYPLLPPNPIQDYIHDRLGKEADYLSEYLHNSIYIESDAFESANTALLGSTKIFRPAINIFVRIGGDDYIFDTLADYITFISQRDVQYYQREYNLTVPYWNLFSLSSDGSEPSWKNVKLGSKIRISENYKEYKDGIWTEGVRNKDYTVVSIETNLQKPEVRLKLHSLEKIDFSTWDGDIGDIVNIFYQLPAIANQSPTTLDTSASVIEIEAAGTIVAGDVVMMTPEGNIVKAQNKSEYYHYPVGIALRAGGTGDIITVQKSGEVQSYRYDFTETGRMIQLRYNPSGLNLSTNLLAEKTADEDTIVILGHSLSVDSFYLNIVKMVLA
ncbi:MAG: hypothetical protein KIT33_09815 [Candidatus Kapabacteria bacterium]|nr:hypothetical protein [Ignavibacteriota bacterium]MCW5885253.1 hypothetical protein [Candidatus Kapabacteria bacterium]